MVVRLNHSGCTVLKKGFDYYHHRREAPADATCSHLDIGPPAIDSLSLRRGLGAKAVWVERTSNIAAGAERAFAFGRLWLLDAPIASRNSGFERDEESGSGRTAEAAVRRTM